MEKKAQHTPEPWRYIHQVASNFSHDITSPNWGLIAACGFCETQNSVPGANAERIVACVNACAGIEDPEKTIPEAMEALRFKRQWQGKQ